MRWCRVEVAGERFAGRVDGDRIVRVDGDFLGKCTDRAESHDLDQVRWLPPVIPPTFYAVGFNYRQHIEHAIRISGGKAQYPTRPEVGYRANNALIGHLDAVIKPADCTGRFELEAEIVAVIGRRLRNCSRSEARDGIFGWTIGNDVSAREWQHADRTFYRAKNSDTFKPMGPWIDTNATPDGATTEVRVNGTEVAGFATDDMVFDAVDYIEEISRYCTLWPGDVLWMGADGASAIEPGDTVEISISGLGTLRNSVVQGN